MEKYKCQICGFIYDPAEGDQANGIAPGTPFSELQADYECPVCSAGKDEFFVSD
jgi:rubredoxin